jgi:hypothetical protein
VDVVAPDERRKRPCEDKERNGAKKRAAYFLSCSFFCAVKCLWNGGRRLFLPTTDWNSRAEQRKRPERDRLIARVLFNGNVLFELVCLEMRIFSLLATISLF